MTNLMHIIRTIAVTLFAAVALTACNDTDSRLENKWQLRSYEFPDGRTQREDSVFYNFQSGSFSAICVLPDANYETFYGLYTLTDNKISINLLPESLQSPNYQRYMAWPEGQRTFTLQQLNTNSMTLVYDKTLLHFRSY